MEKLAIVSHRKLKKDTSSSIEILLKDLLLSSGAKDEAAHRMVSSLNEVLLYWCWSTKFNWIYSLSTYDPSDTTSKNTGTYSRVMFVMRRSRWVEYEELTFKIFSGLS